MIEINLIPDYAEAGDLIGAPSAEEMRSQLLQMERLLNHPTRKRDNLGKVMQMLGKLNDYQVLVRPLPIMSTPGTIPGLIPIAVRHHGTSLDPSTEAHWTT